MDAPGRSCKLLDQFTNLLSAACLANRGRLLTGGDMDVLQCIGVVEPQAGAGEHRPHLGIGPLTLASRHVGVEVLGPGALVFGGKEI